jgi:hypothetical protein
LPSTGTCSGSRATLSELIDKDGRIPHWAGAARPYPSFGPSVAEHQRGMMSGERWAAHHPKA